MRKSIKKVLKILSFVIVLIILYSILRGIGFINIYNTLKIADIKYIILTFLSAFAVFLIWNYKWYLLVKEVKKPKFLQIFPMLMAGSFINTTTPGAKVGGEPLRAYYLSKQYKLEKSKFFATTIVDRTINTIAFAALSIFSILFVILFMNIEIWIRTILEIILVLLLLAILGGFIIKQKVKFKRKYITTVLTKIYYFYLFKIIRKRFNTYKKFENYVIKKLENIINTFKKLIKKEKVFKKDLFLSFLMWFFNYLGTFFLFKALGYKISFLAIIIVVTLSVFIGSLFALPGGIGVIETIMISLYFSFGISSGVAATVAVMDRFIFYFYSLLIGGICLVYLNLKYK
jgi:uncharacterized protein (TIRG00374 family)